MDRFSRLVVFLVVSLVVFVVLSVLPTPARAVDFVSPSPTRVYTTTCITGVELSGNLGLVMGACNDRFIAQGKRSGTYNGCPVSYTRSGSMSLKSETPNGSGGSASFAFTGEDSFVGTSTGSCSAANMKGSFVVGGPAYVVASATWATVQGCEQGSSLVGPAGAQYCRCDPGYNVQSGKCKQYTCPPSGSYSPVTQPDQKVSNAGDTQCSGGCSFTPSSWKVGNDGQIWATWPFKSTGSFCGGAKRTDAPEADSGEQNTKNPAPIPCGTNQCPGTVNGQAVCVPCKGQQEQGPSTSASAPAGSASGAQPGTSDTTTTCNGVNCTTTTTTKDGSGNVTGTTDKTQKQESFCKENPTSALCKQSSFGGQCGAVTCEGDAVQCAIAADQYRRNCQWFDDEASAQLATVGNAAITGAVRPDGHPANSPDAQSVSFSTAIDQTDRLGGGCPVDVTVSVAGKSVAIPFSSMCGNLQLVGNLMAGFCMFVAALIVFRS